MLTHVTSAALASENKVLSHPASVDTIPTSGNKEDHVSMGVHAALKAQDILENVKNILAIEFLAAYQGLFLLRPLKTSPVLEKVYSVLSQKVSPIHKDRVFATDIENIKTLSDHREASFGIAYGVLVKELRLLARSVFVIDAQDRGRGVAGVS